MSGFKIIDPETKAQAVKDVKDGGMKVSEVALKYDVQSRTIYSWLKQGVGNSERSLILENNKLKKENEQLYNLLGRATAEMKRPKG